MTKGYFPYLYNTKEINVDESKKHLPHLPHVMYYDADSVNTQK